MCLPSKTVGCRCRKRYHDLVVALVDGDYSDAEKAVVNSYAEAFGIPPDRLEELASSVKAFLMAPLLSSTLDFLAKKRKLKRNEIWAKNYSYEYIPLVER